MTNLVRSGSGTARLEPDRSRAPRADIYSIVSPAQHTRLQPDLPGMRFDLFRVPRAKSQVGWRLTVYDVRMGIGMTKGFMEAAHGRLKASTLDGRWGDLVLPQFTTAVAADDAISGGHKVLSWAHVFDRLLIAIGNGDVGDNALFVENPTTGAITGLTFSPNGLIYAIVPLVIGGASAATRLGVFGGDDGEIISDATGASAGNMHANTDPCYGAAQSPAPDGTILLYIDTTIRTLLKTNAIGDEPTTVMSNIPPAGYFVGWSALQGGVARLLAVFPKDSSSGVPMTKFGAERLGDLVSLRDDGTDWRRVELPSSILGKGTLWCFKYRDGIINSDGISAGFYNGREKRPLRVFRDVEHDSDRAYRIRGGYANDEELVLNINRIASTNGTGNTEEALWSYDWDLDAWQQITKWTTLSTTGLLGIGSNVGALPLSPVTGYAHRFVDGSWHRTLMVPHGVTPLSLAQTSGAQSSSGTAVEASGTASWPSMIFPAPYEYCPKVVDRIWCGGDIDAGGTGAYQEITAGGVYHKFNATLNKASRLYEAPSRNQHRFLFLDDLATTLARGTGDTLHNLNGLPFIIEGRIFLDERKERGWLSW